METKYKYSAEDIKVLNGLEAVRKRPAMYIGDTGMRGLHHLIFEVVDNSIDEALMGFCTHIIVILHKDSSVTIIDNGRGIPTDVHPQEKKSAVEVVMTTLHSGGKFDKKIYQVSGGLHGVGLSVVNALSKWLIIEVVRDGKKYLQRYEYGKPMTQLLINSETNGLASGTIITFMPDDSIFPITSFDYNLIINRLRELAFLNKGLVIELKDERDIKEKRFQYDGGIISFVEYLNKNKTALHQPIFVKKEKDNVLVEVVLQYNDGYLETVYSFCNNINTVEHGTHYMGFCSALTRVVNEYIKKNELGDLKLQGTDVREGLSAVVNIKVPEPQFEGQTKTKLGNIEIKGIVESIVYDGLNIYFEENPETARLIVAKALNAAKTREVVRKAKELARRKNVFDSGSLPGKLADCQEQDPMKCELYLVEGDSAGGCFSGDTKVALADGRNISFNELVEEHKQGKENFCYTIKKDNGISIAKIENPRITKKNVQVIKVTLDNNEEIICTPKHEFMSRSGAYKKISDLTKEDSIMPLYKKISKVNGRITIKGYEMVWDTNKKWIFTHLLADEYNIKNKIYSKDCGGYKHHIDFNKLNNNPTNIIRLPKEEHLILHARHLEKTLHRSDVKEKAKKAHKRPEYRQKISEWAKQPKIQKLLSERAKKQWSNHQYKKFMINKFIEFYNKNNEYRERNNKVLNEQQKRYWSNLENRKKAADRSKQFFEKNPSAKSSLSNLAKKQWKNMSLIEWRRQKTKEQWTLEFRKKRKIAYNQTYYRKTIELMKNILENHGSLEKFDKVRISNKDKSILSIKTFCSRFFDNNQKKMLEAIKNYNHKIKKVERLTNKIDVYDLEVKDTHNFALASGIFVHNSAKQGRMREFQAILPLKGKILNVEKARPDKIFSNKEIMAMISAIGTSVSDEFDIKKLRYGKIIIMTDADVDGSHICCLMLTFFYRYMKPLIENGNVYIAQPPLYRVSKGKENFYLFTEEEMNKLANKGDVQRYKGLGEMNPEQLWETTMNPKNRILKQVTIRDAIEADEIFTILMGDQVEPRRDFIQKHAKTVRNLDV